MKRLEFRNLSSNGQQKVKKEVELMRKMVTKEGIDSRFLLACENAIIIDKKDVIVCCVASY